MNSEKLWSRNFLAISLSSFFVFITFYMLAVALPVFVLEQLQGNKEGIGLVTTVFIIAAVVSRPLTGKYLGQVNRKKLTLASVALFALCSFLYLFIHDYSLLLALRFVHGLTFGISATAVSAIILDVIPEKRKGEGIGYFSLFMSIAMVIGPFLGLSMVSDSNYNVMFTAITIFSILSFICICIAQVPKMLDKSPALSAWNIKSYIEPSAIPISLTGFVMAFSYAGISTFIYIFAKSIGLERYASFFFIVFAALILLSRPFTGRLYDKKGAHILVYPGIVLFTVGMIWLSQAESPLVFFITAGMLGLGYGAMLPSFQTIAVQTAPPHRRALATSTYFVFFDLGFGIGSYVLGLIAAKTDYRSMFLIGGVSVALMAVIYYILHHRREQLQLKTVEGGTRSQQVASEV